MRSVNFSTGFKQPRLADACVLCSATDGPIGAGQVRWRMATGDSVVPQLRQGHATLFIVTATALVGRNATLVVAAREEKKTIDNGADR